MMLGNLIELQFGQGRNWPLGAALAMRCWSSWWRRWSLSALGQPRGGARG
jgi:hypothetical protein